MNISIDFINTLIYSLPFLSTIHKLNRYGKCILSIQY